MPSTRRSTRWGVAVDQRPVANDLRVTAAFLVAKGYETVSEAVELLKSVIDDVEILTIKPTSEHGTPRIIVSLVINTMASSYPDLHEDLYTKYEFSRSILSDFEGVVDCEVIRKGVSSNLQQLDSPIPDAVGATNAVALGQNGVLNAQTLYDMYWNGVGAEGARERLLGEYGTSPYDPYTPYKVFRVSDDSDLVCRMVEHNGEMRWLTIGAESQVLAIEPFEHVPRLLPVDPIGPPPYTYSARLMMLDEPEEAARRNLINFITTVIGVDNVVASSPIERRGVTTNGTRYTAACDIVYRSKRQAVFEYGRMRYAVIDRDEGMALFALDLRRCNC